MPSHRKTQVIRTRDLYELYAIKLLRENPNYFSMVNRNYSGIRHFYVREKRGNRVHEVISYPRFAKIIRTFFLQARRKIIQGAKFSLWNKIGAIQARRVERDFTKKTVNWGATHKAGQRDPITGKLKLVYFTDADWCRIGWDMPRRGVTRIKRYEFVPSDGEGKGGFKDEFRSALRADPTLQYRFTYYPFLDARVEAS